MGGERSLSLRLVKFCIPLSGGVSSESPLVSRCTGAASSKYFRCFNMWWESDARSRPVITKNTLCVFARWARGQWRWAGRDLQTPPLHLAKMSPNWQNVKFSTAYMPVDFFFQMLLVRFGQTNADNKKWIDLVELLLKANNKRAGSVLSFEHEKLIYRNNSVGRKAWAVRYRLWSKSFFKFCILPLCTLIYYYDL